MKHRAGQMRNLLSIVLRGSHRDSLSLAARWIGASSAALLVAILITYVITEERAPRITIEWTDDAPQERETLERQFQLAESEYVSDKTWEYDLRDIYSGNVRTILQHPRVASTRGFDAASFRVVGSAPRGNSRVWLADGLPVVSSPFVVPSIALGLLVLIGASAGTLWWSLLCRSVPRAVLFLRRRIPVVTDDELGFVRVIFAALLLLSFVVLRLPSESFPRAAHLNNSPIADVRWVHWLASRPDNVGLLEMTIVVTLVWFAAGLWTRPVYWFLTAQLVVWSLVRLQHAGLHQWAPALMTVIALLPVRWGDGFSLDAAIRRARTDAHPRRLRGRDYGFALWVPGLVLGLCMAAAGIAKLRGGGFEWILQGAVRYYFVIDSRNAPVDWGLWIATQPWLAIALSFAAVAIEIGLGAGPLLRSYVARAPLACAGLGLLCGFYLLQHEGWLAWWMLWALFYLPWHLMFRRIRVWLLVRATGRACRTVIERNRAAPRPNSGSADHRSAGRLDWRHVAIVVLLCTLQGIASLGRIEIEPLLSDYSMYSSTFASTDDFDRRNAIPPAYAISAIIDGQERDITDLLEQLRVDDLFRDVMTRVVSAETISGDVKARFRRAVERVEIASDSNLEEVSIRADQQAFDWNDGMFYWRYRGRLLGTLDVTTLAFHPDRGITRP